MLSGHLIHQVALWALIIMAVVSVVLAVMVARHKPAGRHHATRPPGPPDEPGAGTQEDMERLPADDEWEPSGPLARWAGKIRNEFRLIPLGGPKR